ncbi:T9SS type A sorting domain-containing protein [Caldithrix abyssi]|nr:T9SS type A sorting domain-containing protein [Caldithrix abyssi]
MNQRIDRLILYGIILCFSSDLCAQWEFVGLSGKRVETLRLNGDVIYASTDDGIYRKSVNITDTVWTPIGFLGKKTKALLIMNADTILTSIRITGVGSDTVSLFRTTTGGANWRPYQNGFGGQALYNQVLALEALPNQPDTLFATGQYVVGKSTDRGLTWKKVWGQWDWIGMGTHFVKIDPAMPNIVWAGGESAIFQPYVLKSTDSGENWQEMWIDAGGDNACYTIAIDPSNSNVAYVGMEGRIIKTTNGGDDWDTVFAPDNYPYFFGIAVSSLMPSHIYAAGLLNISDPQDLELYQSQDGGSSWSSLVQGTPGQKGVLDLLLVSNNNFDELYFVTIGSGVYKYTNETLNIDESTERQLPTLFTLDQNYPNPFNSSTQISYSIPSSHFVTLKIYDILGREIQTLVSEVQNAGTYSINLDINKLSSGIYFYKLQVGDTFVKTKKMLLMY